VKDFLRRLRKGLACRDSRDLDERVAHEAARQGRIEAPFDRADLFYSVGDIEPALEWRRAAEALRGDLPPRYRARRAQMVCDRAVRIEIGAKG
jgi:hypothetical protein